MRVDFYGIYRPLAGGKTLEFELEHGATLRVLLSAIVTRFPTLRDEQHILQSTSRAAFSDPSNGGRHPFSPSCHPG